MHHHLENAKAEIDRTVAGIAAPALAKGREGKWSPAQILEHLTLAYTGTASAVQKALQSGELRTKPPQLRQHAIRMLVVDFGYFPRVEAPTITTPTGTIRPEDAARAAAGALEAMDAALTEARERFGAGALVANHPYFAGMTADQWRKFHWRHTRHHMKQISALLTSERG